MASFGKYDQPVDLGLPHQTPSSNTLKFVYMSDFCTRVRHNLDFHNFHKPIMAQDHHLSFVAICCHDNVIPFIITSQLMMDAYYSHGQPWSPRNSWLSQSTSHTSFRIPSGRRGRIRTEPQICSYENARGHQFSKVSKEIPQWYPLVT